MIAVHFLPPLGAIACVCGTSSERLSPSGVRSNAQARISATGKPRITAVTNTFITHEGASNVGNRMEVAWIRSQATIAYATATLYTLRRFNSVKKMAGSIAASGTLAQHTFLCTNRNLQSRTRRALQFSALILTGFLVRITPRFALPRLMDYLNMQGSRDGPS